MTATTRPETEKPNQPATINASDKNIDLLMDIFSKWNDDFSQKDIIENDQIMIL